MRKAQTNSTEMRSMRCTIIRTAWKVGEQMMVLEIACLEMDKTRQVLWLLEQTLEEPKSLFEELVCQKLLRSED